VRSRSSHSGLLDKTATLDELVLQSESLQRNTDQFSSSKQKKSSGFFGGFFGGSSNSNNSNNSKDKNKRNDEDSYASKESINVHVDFNSSSSIAYEGSPSRNDEAMDQQSFGGEDSKKEMKKEVEEEAKPAPTIVRDLILKMKFKGYWEVESLAAVVTSLSKDSVSKALPSSFSSNNDAINLFASVIVITLFAAAFKDFADSWTLVSNKAKKWIAKEQQRLKMDEVDCESLAKNLLTSKKLI